MQYTRSIWSGIKTPRIFWEKEAVEEIFTNIEVFWYQIKHSIWMAFGISNEFLWKEIRLKVVEISKTTT